MRSWPTRIGIAIVAALAELSLAGCPKGDFRLPGRLDQQLLQP